jgi:hypothetical protein
VCRPLTCPVPVRCISSDLILSYLIPGCSLPATPEGLRERACRGSPTTAKEAGVDLRDLLQSIEDQVKDACPPIARDALAALEVPIRQSSGHSRSAFRGRRPLSSVCGKRNLS